MSVLNVFLLCLVDFKLDSIYQCWELLIGTKEIGEVLSKNTAATIQAEMLLREEIAQQRQCFVQAKSNPKENFNVFISLFLSYRECYPNI